MELIGSYILFWMGAYQHIGKMALYYDSCCSSAVKSCRIAWNCYWVIYKAWHWNRNDETTSAVWSQFTCCFTHLIDVLCFFWVYKRYYNSKYTKCFTCEKLVQINEQLRYYHKRSKFTLNSKSTRLSDYAEVDWGRVDQSQIWNLRLTDTFTNSSYVHLTTEDIFFFNWHILKRNQGNWEHAPSTNINISCIQFVAMWLEQTELLKKNPIKAVSVSFLNYYNQNMYSILKYFR